jgi:hypothetical protein
MNGSWPHPAKLPLGAGWRGQCSASDAHVPSDADLQDHCNFGYSKCDKLPDEREVDAVRFVVASAKNGKIVVRYACEREHRPADCGTLEFDRHQNTWSKPHLNLRVQRMAECYLDAYLSRCR